jgi:hypothetical protein
MGEYATKKAGAFLDLYNLGSGEPINTARSFHIWTGP